MQQARRHGQKQFDPTPEEIQSKCLLIRSEWTLQQRLSAMTDAPTARLQADWDPRWDDELQHQEQDQCHG